MNEKCQNFEAKKLIELDRSGVLIDQRPFQSTLKRLGDNFEYSKKERSRMYTGKHEDSKI